MSDQRNDDDGRIGSTRPSMRRATIVTNWAAGGFALLGVASGSTGWSMAAIMSIIGGHLGRVVALGVRWWKDGDNRASAAALALLTAIAMSVGFSLGR
jgi:hypothetical protein